MAEESGRPCTFKVETPRFSTIIRDDSLRDGKLCLPKLFTAEYGALFPDEVLLLELPSRAEWQVGLVKSGEKIWFHEGFQEFAQFYGIASGHLLVFEYVSHGRFLVLIFDRTATEIDYQTHEANERVESECRIDISDDSSDDHLSSPEAREKSPLKSPRPKKLKRRRNESGSVGRTSEAMFCRGSTSRVQDNSNQKRSRTSQKEKTLTTDERASELARAIFAFQSGNPYFMIVMQKSYLATGMRLYLPIYFANAHFEGKCGDIELQLPNGRAWMVKYHFMNVYSNRKRAVFLPGGWGQFARENILRVGDVCVFELVEGGANLRLKVIIFRAAPEDSSRCSSPCQFENGLNYVKPNRESHSPGNMRKPSKHEAEVEDDGDGQQECFTQSGHVDAANAFASKQQFFRITVADCHLSKGQVTIPQAFSNRVEEVCDEAVLRLADKCWPVRIGRTLRKRGQQQKYLGSGWRAFAKCNGLKVGDVCDYELIKGKNDDASKRKMVLDVHISRA